jgi:predicted RNA-binding protein YlxR (DUF448 family)
MSGFSNLWRIRTHKHIRTIRSISSKTGPGRGLWLRLQETEQQREDLKRLRARQRLHEKRRGV